MPGTAVIDSFGGVPSSPPAPGTQVTVTVNAHEDMPAGTPIPITVTFPDGSMATGSVNWPTSQRITAGYHVAAAIPAGLAVLVAQGSAPNQLVFTQQ